MSKDPNRVRQGSAQLGLGAWFKDTPEARQMLAEEELELDRDEWKARAKEAQKVIEAVRELHARRQPPPGRPARVFDGYVCHACADIWPCPTIRALPQVAP